MIENALVWKVPYGIAHENDMQYRLVKINILEADNF